MKLSVVIVVYRSESVIFDCLNSIDKYNEFGKDLEVIIVDNEPEGKSIYAFNPAHYGFELRYKNAGANKGFGGGNNLGVELAISDCILFLNPDTILEEPIFKDVYAKMTEDPNLIYGFSLIDKAKNRNNSYSFFYDSFWKYRLMSLCKAISYTLPLKMKRANKMLWPWGAAFAIRKSTFVEAGFFDENIFLCNEEPDLLKRIPKRKVYISPHHIIHLEGHGAVVSENRYYHSFKSFDYYQKKYGMSKLNCRLWDAYVKLVCLIYMWFSNDESNINYVKAYTRFREEKQGLNKKE